MSVTIKLKPRSAVIPFEIEMPLDDFLTLGTKDLVTLFLSIETTQTVIMNALSEEYEKQKILKGEKPCQKNLKKSV